MKPPAWTVLLFLLGDVAGASAAARARPAARPAASDPSGPDVSATYSFLRAGEAHLHGADVSASFRFRSRWRLLGDLSLHSGSFAGTHLKQTNFMAGAGPQTTLAAANCRIASIRVASLIVSRSA